MELHNVYANELLHYRLGLPLWLPEPSPEWGSVKLADVGYVADGKFYRLFNASLPADDPSHKRLGVPEGFEQLTDLEYSTTEKFLDPGPLHSTTIRQVGFGAAVSGATLPAGVSFEFQQASSKGAVLVLKTHLIKEMIEHYRGDKIKKYILAHSHSWETFANKRHGRGMKLQQIMLVTHCYKTSSWASAVTFDVSGGFSLKFSAGVLGVLNAELSASTKSEHRGSAVCRSGPAMEDGAYTSNAEQTVFVQGWRVKRFMSHINTRVFQSSSSEELKLPAGDDDCSLNLLLPSQPMELHGPTAREVSDSHSAASSGGQRVMFVDPTQAVFKDNSFWFGEGLSTAHDDDWCSTSEDEFHSIMQQAAKDSSDALQVDIPGKHELNPLERAAYDGDEALVETMLQSGADVTAGGRIFGTPLQAAVAGGHKGIVTLLLERGADINALGGINGGALHIAVRGDDESLVQLLLDKGADSSAQSTFLPRSPLQIASALGQDAALRILMLHGASPNPQPGNRGPSALRTAFDHAHMSIVRQLLQNGAEVHRETGLFKAILDRASASGDEATLRILLESIDAHSVEIPDYAVLCGNAMISASNHAHEPVIRLLLSHGADVNTMDRSTQITPLQAASASGDETMVRLLLDRGAGVLIHGINGSPVTAASAKGSAAVVRLLLDNGAGADQQRLNTALVNASGSESGNVEVVRLLLEAGADVNARGRYHSSPLEHAAQKGHELIAHLLVERGANVNAGLQREEYVRNGIRLRVEAVGGSPLRAAAGGGHLGIVRLLLGHGADVDGVADGRYGSALRAAAQNGHEETVRLLLDAGADVGLTNPLEGAADIGHEALTRLFLDRGADVNVKTGRTNALQAAVAKGHECVARLLLDAGADVNIEGKIDKSPLHAAVLDGHERMVQLLLERGADVNAHESHALKVASSKGREDIVRMLLESGADVNPNGSYKWTALEAASQSRFDNAPSITRLLLKNGADLNARPELFKSILEHVSMFSNLHGKTAADVIRVLLEYAARVQGLGGFYTRAIENSLLGSGEEGVEIARMLLEYGAATSTEDGETAGKGLGHILKKAQQYGNWDMVRLLFQYGAATDPAEKEGESVIQ